MPVVHDDPPRAYNGVGQVEMDRTTNANSVRRQRYYYNTDGGRAATGNRDLPRYRYYRRPNSIPRNSQVEVRNIQAYMLVPLPASPTPTQLARPQINVYTEHRIWDRRTKSWGLWQGPFI